MRPHSKLVFDCHLMVTNPEKHIEEFVRAGADIITIHVEATPHIHGALQQIRAAGVKAGVVINPGTPVQAIKHVLGLVDQVLVMTVNPGFGGQAFLPETLVKVSELASLREQEQLQFDIEDVYKRQLQKRSRFLVRRNGMMRTTKMVSVQLLLRLKF